MPSFFNNLSVTNLEVTNFRVHNSASLGAATNVGQLKFYLTDGSLYVADGSSWNRLLTDVAGANAFSAITDGTTTANADTGSDTFKLRSASNLLTIAVTNDDVTHGDNALYTINQGNFTHSSIGGVTTGDAGHTQFVMLAGRSGSQIVYGGTASGDDLTLYSTSHGTKGHIQIGGNGAGGYYTKWNELTETFTIGLDSGFRLQVIPSTISPSGSGVGVGTSIIMTDGTTDYLKVTGNGDITAPIGSLIIGGTTSLGGTIASIDENTGTDRGVVIQQHNDTNKPAKIEMYRSRGTYASPTTVASGDYAGMVFTSVYDGTAYRAIGSYGYRVLSVAGSNNIPGEWFWSSSIDNQDDPYTAGTVRMKLDTNGDLWVSGDLTVENTITADSFIGAVAASGITGTVPVAHGGTGVTSFGGTNRLLYTTATDTLSSITTQNSRVLITDGSGVPSWGTTLPAVSGASLTSLTGSNISTGTIAVTVGGTGTTSAPSQGGVIYGASTSAYASTGAGTSGQVLQSNGTSAPTWVSLDLSTIVSAYKKSVIAATTANITLSGTQTIDGVSVIATNRVLVKNQSTPANNGIYACAAGSWSRVADFDAASEAAGAIVTVDSGTTNGGKKFTTNFKSTDTLGTTAMSWYEIVDDGTTQTLTNKTMSTSSVWNGNTIGVGYGGTGVTSFGGTNTLLYTSSANTLTSLTTQNSRVLITDGSGVPSWGTTLPAVSGVNLTALNMDNAGSGTLVVGRGGTGTTTAPTSGGVIYAASTSAYASTALGTTSQVLIGGTTPSWSGSPTINGSNITSLNADNIGAGTLSVGRGGTGITSTPTLGGVVFGSTSSALGYTAAGTSGQLLQSAGSSTPTWITATSSSTNDTIMKRDGTGGTVVTTLNATTVASTSVTSTTISGTNTTSDTYNTTSGTVIIDGSSGSQIRVTDGDVTTYFSVSSVGAVVGASFAGVGSSLTSLNAGNISSGTLVVGRGGTGLASYAVGDLIYASAGTTLAKLADVATGNALISGGVTTAPLWGKIGLTTHISGTLAVGNGGTGATSLTTNGILYGGSTVSATASANNSILVTNGSGVPSLSTTIPAFTAGGDIAMGGNKITGAADPSSAQDYATKAYVDSVAIGIMDFKNSVRAATTANITLSGAQTIDGVSVIAGDRVLVKNQSTASANGIYVCAAGSWSRSSDADASSEVTGGMFVFVTEGSTQADTGWVLSTNDAITLGSTSLSFTQFSGAGTYTSGTGIGISGTVISASTALQAVHTIVGAGTAGIFAVTSANTVTARAITGTTNFITVTNGSGVSGDPTITISTGYVGQTSITTLGTIGTGVWNGTAVTTAYGGTGQTTYTAGDMLYYTSGTTLTKLAAASTGNALLSGTAPTWGKIGLATHISGVLPIANGGTNAADIATARTNLSSTGFDLPQKYATTIGDGSSTSYVITHGLGSRDVIISVHTVAAPYETIYTDIERTSTTTATIRFAVAPTTNQFRVVAIG